MPFEIDPVTGRRRFVSRRESEAKRIETDPDFARRRAEAEARQAQRRAARAGITVAERENISGHEQRQARLGELEDRVTTTALTAQKAADTAQMGLTPTQFDANQRAAELAETQRRQRLEELTADERERGRQDRLTLAQRDAGTARREFVDRLFDTGEKIGTAFAKGVESSRKRQFEAEQNRLDRESAAEVARIEADADRGNPEAKTRMATLDAVNSEINSIYRGAPVQGDDQTADLTEADRIRLKTLQKVKDRIIQQATAETQNRDGSQNRTGRERDRGAPDTGGQTPAGAVARVTVEMDDGRRVAGFRMADGSIVDAEGNVIMEAGVATNR